MFRKIKNIPRVVVLIIDMFIVIASVVLAYMLRFNFSIPEVELDPFPQILGYIVLVRLVSFLIGRTYVGIIKYTSTEDVVRIFLVVFSGSLIFVLTNLVTYYVISGLFFIPFSIIIIDFISTVLILTAFRMVVKVAYMEMATHSGERSDIIIYGAGEAGLIAKRTLDRDVETNYRVVAFIDDNPGKTGKQMEGVNIYPSKKLPDILQKWPVAQLIVSPQQMSQVRKQEIIETCLENNIRVLNVPPVSQWINGELSSKQIRKVKIEDLLGRDVIHLDKEQVSKDLAGRDILITGASGSIGSEIVRQVAGYAINRLILLDQAESPLFYLDLECTEKFGSKNIEIVVADICDKDRMEEIFKKFKPHLIYHAAAYKHVPMMESNPSEAVRTNIYGTILLANLAVKYAAAKFIMISTDKAVKPTSVMGASKRIAEMYTQSMNSKNGTRFITTRFGNVLGSNGSVIPLFREQISRGGPVTVTHPEITRYFMTIPEACQLVLEAGAMGHGGEIYIFDMGQSVKIVDLAKKMIMLSGLTLGTDIQIKFTGLRPGEKLYEELLNDEENTLPTHHPQIMIAREREFDLEMVTKQVNELISINNGLDGFAIVKKMKEIAPEFVSKNSIFEQLDKKE
ncbi:MAG: nucleoside-diphosphate sugar epimerase/dehydratase [Bacteroidales bacterium]|jgi:FlaA1/EpsC-like NDP-sugar epimerase|nr:nucleoside-diphosphate sugar epimerase/dehydratase [Bacteroidales bacterium]